MAGEWRKQIVGKLVEYADLPEEGGWCEECKGTGDLGGGFECTYCQNADIEHRDQLRAALEASDRASQ